MQPFPLFCSNWPGTRMRPHPLAQAVLLLCCALSPAMAQTAPPAAATPATPPMAAPAKATTFAIKAFKVTGDNPLGEGETTRILAPFLRSDATIDTLQKATAALEAALRNKGFGLHRVALPPQEVGDTVQLIIVKFAIHKVTIEGLQRYDAANIRRSVPELQEGQTPNFKTLAVQTAIANESQGKQLTVSLKESDEPDKIDADLKVKEAKPWNFAVNWANTGNAATGKDRLTFAGGYSNLFDRDQQLVAAYTTSLSNRSNVKQLGLSYRVPLYAWGGVIGVTHTQSDVVGNFGAFTSTGAGKTNGINYTHYLAPDAGYRGYVNLGLEDKLFKGAQINGVQAALDTRSRPLTLGYNARKDNDLSAWAYNAELAFNLAGGQGNDLNAYTNGSTNPIYDTARFKILRAGASYSATLGKNWLWSVRGLAQYTPNALIAGEAFGLGGSTSVRGASERVISADKGWFTSIEISAPPLREGLRMLGFVDAGWLYNNNNAAATASAARPANDKLTSAGLGLRYTGSNGVVLTADYGRIINGSAVPLTINSSAPKRGDAKFHVSLSVRF